jgi:hypothetical protein
MHFNVVANESLFIEVIMFRVIPVLHQVVGSVGLGVLNKYGTIVIRSPRILNVNM